MKSLLVLPVLLLLLNSCINRETVHGNGNETTEIRNPGSFNRIQLMGSMDVEIKKGDERSVEIKAEENLLPYIETKVEGDKLIVKFSNDVNIDADKDIIVKVTTPVLTEASVMGSGDISGNGKFESSDKITINVLGSGNVKMELDAPAIEAKVTGSGDIDIAGNTKDAVYNTMGSGNIKASDLKAENTEAKTMGSGNINAFASVKLKVTIMGSGDISYKGGGAVTSNVHGSGSVKAIE
ncbi:MAG: head GIN domain-containing protein [Agriterribacter sp.]